MKLKIIHLCCVLMIIMVITGTAYASKIELGFNSVELVTNAINLDTRPEPELTKIVEGPYIINLKGIGEKKELTICFTAENPETYALMTAHLEVQYCVQSSDGEEQWSEWRYFGQLPLTIQFREDKYGHSQADTQGNNNSPGQAVVLLRFRVPQSLQLRHGVFIGEFLLNVS